MSITPTFIEQHWPLTDVTFGAELRRNGVSRVIEVLAREGRFVYKVAHVWKTPEAIKRDLTVFDILPKKGFHHLPGLLKTNSAESFVNNNGELIYILDFVEGIPLEPIPREYERLADITAELHGIKDFPFKSDFNPAALIPDLALQADTYDFGIQYKMVLETIRPFDALPQTLIHTDIAPGNAIRTEDGRIIFLDWDDIGVGATVIDLGLPLINQFIGLDLKLHKENARAFYRGYFSRRRITPEELDHIFDAGLFWACFGINFSATLKRWQRIAWAVDNKDKILATFKLDL